MSSYLVALNVVDRPCLVIGSGREAVEKARRLADAGARVTVIGAAPDPTLRAMAEAGVIGLRERSFDLDLDLVEVPFVIVSSLDDVAFNERLRARVTPLGALVCCLDAPTQCDFFHTAQAPCGPLTLAVASNGAAPMLARRLRDELVRQLATPMTVLGDAVISLRRALPKSERRARLAEALDGFSVDLQVKLPRWLAGDSKDPAGH